VGGVVDFSRILNLRNVVSLGVEVVTATADSSVSRVMAADAVVVEVVNEDSRRLDTNRE
jgi:hypothetical protein